MAIKRYKPTSPAHRFMTVSAYTEITCDKPEKSLVEDMRKTGGRNANGRITVRHIGGGNKRKYRIIDFKEIKTEFQQYLRAFNTTQIERLILHYFATRTAKRDTF